MAITKGDLERHGIGELWDDKTQQMIIPFKALVPLWTDVPEDFYLDFPFDEEIRARIEQKKNDKRFKI